MTSVARPADASAKIVLLGDSAVGKSSLALRFVKEEFHPNQETTIGGAYLFRTVTVPPTAGSPNGASRTLKLEIWDTAGQERYRSLAPIYYRGACGALVVYDITNKESLTRARSWIQELRQSADPNLVILLIGNKKDLDTLRQVSVEEGVAAAREEAVAGFYETSAKDNNKGSNNVETAFADLAAKLLDSGRTSNHNAARAKAANNNVIQPGRLGEPQPDANNNNAGCC
ncbi:Rab family, other [Angomonas deanei]|uniref:ADP-ribosylation factor family/Ras of Complex, Roc, domain of DAPkinase/Ras family, putative n=1 Tax=Angomonas deanei TaxID=59799 RepID=A0A7G2CS07_9TRYP|nr:Rab family, other [Angomonas deanei]CAD2222315.1 ADP-ribosylation factor family/Ras of Complex, Roc, domain of DAPkinase/Ras family, putative [Angomonas deanei]|eukprot:EPY42209.1 Rab family, other [Angomonas deanei]